MYLLPTEVIYRSAERCQFGTIALRRIAKKKLFLRESSTSCQKNHKKSSAWSRLLLGTTVLVSFFVQVLHTYLSSHPLTKNKRTAPRSPA
jgi:hypothetical protein